MPCLDRLCSFDTLCRANPPRRLVDLREQTHLSTFAVCCYGICGNSWLSKSFVWHLLGPLSVPYNPQRRQHAGSHKNGHQAPFGTTQLTHMFGLWDHDLIKYHTSHCTFQNCSLSEVHSFLRWVSAQHRSNTHDTVHSRLTFSPLSSSNSFTEPMTTISCMSSEAHTGRGVPQNLLLLTAQS